MKRREFITLLGSTTFTWPLAARAQQSAMPVIGYVSARSPEAEASMLVAFRRGLNEAGFVEGKNVAIEFRWANGQYDRLPALVEDLVRRQVAVIVAGGGEVMALAAKATTKTIPIVFNVGGDPVKTGLVTALNQPGGNLTGVTSFLGALGAKRLGLLRELVPTAAVIAVLVNPNDPVSKFELTDVQTAADTMAQQLIVLRATTEREIDAAFMPLAQQRAGALLVNSSPFFVTRANQIVLLATRHAVPVMYVRREFTTVGGLMSYGSITAETYGQMGIYAAKIINGARPSELPVLQPTKFELVINLQAARVIGIEVPATLLARADEVIE